MDRPRIFSWLRWALFYFLLTALLGVVLRLAHIYSIPEWIDYKNIRHAHSHLGMMGWLFCGLYIFIVYYFNLFKPCYKYIFWLLQVSVLGMAITFPIQGYGLLSILFTTLHVLLSYAFIYFVVRDVKRTRDGLFKASRHFLLTALGFLALSTLGVFTVGLLMNTSLGHSKWYYNAVQFFLHFQFNGWFIFASFSLFFKVLEDNDIFVKKKTASIFYGLLVTSCFLTFALAVTWSTPLWFIFLINSVGAILQLVAFLMFYLLIRQVKNRLRTVMSKWTYGLLSFSFYCFAFKVISQSLVALPVLAITSYTVRNFILGFIHLILLGLVSFLLFGLISYTLKRNHRLQKLGAAIIGIGFLSTEFLLFLQGIFLWSGQGYIYKYHEILFSFSVIIPIGVALYFIGFCYNAHSGKT